VQFSPRKTHQIEIPLTQWQMWMAIGRHEFDRHQHLSPHRSVSLGTLARMVDIASQLGRLALGMELKPGKPTSPAEENLDYRAAHPEEALKKICCGGATSMEQSRNVIGDVSDL
jgi:hypothetical protein